MTKKEEYNLNFLIKNTYGRAWPDCQSIDGLHMVLASHLYSSNVPLTEIQIDALTPFLDPTYNNPDDGAFEVFGSYIDVYTNPGFVEIEQQELVPLGDFIQLLQEWLAFSNNI
jgi:hypothetical protein